MVSNYQGHFRSEKDHYPNVKEFMSKSFPSVGPSDDVYKALDLLLDQNMTRVMVVDGEQRYVGQISETDIMKLITLSAYDNASFQGGGTVSEFMDTKVPTVNPEAGLIQVAELFAANNFRKMAVVDGQGKMVGLVRRSDVLGIFKRFREQKDKNFGS